MTPAGRSRPARATRVAVALCAVALGGAAAVPAAAQCPDTAEGYPVSVAWADGGAPDTAFLAAFARAAAFGWQTPGPGRRRLPEWRQVRDRVLPQEPRWADDWTPGPAHRAVLAVTLHRDGRPPAVTPRSGSGDRAFDRSLRSALDDPMPQAPPLPAFPAAVAGDSLRLEIHFGAVPGAGTHRTVRFAARQRPVRLVPGSLRVEAPRGSARPPAATVKYDVGTNGRVVPGSFQLLRASDRAFGRAVEDALVRARFTPAESNCRPIVHTVLQTFGP